MAYVEDPMVDKEYPMFNVEDPMVDEEYPMFNVEDPMVDGEDSLVDLLVDKKIQCSMWNFRWSIRKITAAC